MGKVEYLNRDFFGLEEKELFVREFNYLQENQIPINAVIVDKSGSCYIVGKCEGISKHLTIGSESRVWFNDGTYKIFAVTQIKDLPEHILAKVPKNNFVYKVETTYIPKKDALFLCKNPYEGKSTGMCFKFIYDKSTLIECIFIPSSIKKYFKQDEVKNKKEIYKEMYEISLKTENVFDRALLLKMLQKLEKSTKYYAAILDIELFEHEYEFVKKIYESKTLDWFSVVEELYYLFLSESIYGLDMLQKIKIDYMIKNNKENIITDLKDFKRFLKFSGICTEPGEIQNPSYRNSFIDEVIKIQDNISEKTNIATYKEFMKTISLFDSKMIRKNDFKKLMNLVLDKSTFDNNKVQMMKDLLEIEDICGLMHSVYSDNVENINIFNGKKTKTSLKWYLNYGNIKLDDIQEFKVIDYKKSKDKIESNYLSAILDAFNSVKRRKEIGKKSNLELYKKIISYFDEVFVEISDFKISFDFENKILKEIFRIVSQDKHFLSEILKKESFGYLNVKTYYNKIRTEDIIFNIIEEYL